MSSNTENSHDNEMLRTEIQFLKRELKVKEAEIADLKNDLQHYKNIAKSFVSY